MKKIPEKIRYAGLFPRFMALLYDLLIFCAVFFPVTRIVKGVWIMSPQDHRWVNGLLITDPLCIVFFIIMVLYFIFLEGFAGATAGKWLAGICVLDEEGGKPGSEAKPDQKSSANCGWPAYVEYRRRDTDSHVTRSRALRRSGCGNTGIFRRQTFEVSTYRLRRHTL